jgi:hypothetical protein
MIKRAVITAAAIAGALFATSARADNLVIGVLQDNQVVPQSASDPCIICATTQAHNPVGFGYNNFDSTGNDTNFNLFSSNLTGAFANGVEGTAYTGGQLRNFLSALGEIGFGFGVAVDINSAATPQNGKTPETLEEFRLIDLSLIGPGGTLADGTIFDINGPIALPNIRNGNGSADYLITGFDLSNVGVGDNLIFQATWSHATDGGESFYIVPVVNQVDVPEPGSLWLFGGMLSIGGLAGWWRNRRRSDGDLAAA